MSLMDAYGLSLVSVQIWGTLWGLLSLGFIVGGLVVARRGLGKSPLRTLFWQILSCGSLYFLHDSGIHRITGDRYSSTCA